MRVRSVLQECLFVGLLALAASAHAELWLDNFGPSRPLKIMPAGDSITDDCVTNGAWRAPLQVLLENSGILFTNTGRNQSAGYPGFNKRRHEGYCGSVIGAPGVFAVYNYSATDAYLQNILRDALAVTNNRPDLLLILIGANDIGHGRSPWRIATNDMPNLLNIIFSSVPDANVILAKITSLQDANLGYNAYATNVPIYNATLQSMVNKRRAQGQNVFLADMFSAVDYGTMFLSDHLHPNALGLKAIANEWSTRIQTIGIRSNQLNTVFINGGADWKYCDTGQDLGTNWVQADFDDRNWKQGPARLGYGDPATATTVSFGPDPTNKFITTYFRRSFVVPWNATVTNLNFRLARTGGAVVWLDGQEMFRVNLPVGDLTYTNRALQANSGYSAHIFYQTNLAFVGLPPGTNVVAIEIHQSSTTNTTLGFDLELLANGQLTSPPSLSITALTNQVLLSWPASNGTGFTLYSTTNLANAVTWTPTEAFPATNAGQIVVTQAPAAASRFYRLQKP